MSKRFRHRHFAGDNPEEDPGQDSDWDLAEGLDPEGPSADDLDTFGGEMSPCAHCGREFYDQSSQCPYCGNLTTEPEQKLSLWVVLIALALVVMLVMFMF